MADEHPATTRKTHNKRFHKTRKRPPRHHSTPHALVPRDAAAYLAFSVDALRAWRLQGRGPAYYLAGRAVRYRPADLDAWLAQTRVTPRESRTPQSPTEAA
jgi:hypothetical protein